MERSGSTVAWQIVKSLIPRSRPLGWEPLCEVKDYDGHPVDWPLKRHQYMGGERPIIYTYRHPIEAFLSLRRCFGSDAGLGLKQNTAKNQMEADHDAMMHILNQLDVYRKYQLDMKAGRPVLMLRYEKYYAEPIQRITAISEFIEMKPPLLEHELDMLLSYTDVRANAKRAKGRTFHQDRDHSSGMQAGHVNKKTIGEPSALLMQHATFVRAVLSAVNGENGENDSLVSLRKMCESMGYEIPVPRKRNPHLFSFNSEKLFDF
jgi:hypothetical protein